MAKKRTPKTPAGPPEGEADVRYMLLVPPSWLARVDAAAKAKGLKKAQYIRMVCNERMDADEKGQK